MNFYTSFYETFRVELVKFAQQYSRDGTGEEDLFEDCHLSLCEGYSNLSETDYLKLMKTSIKNRYRDETKKSKNDKNTRLLIPTDLSVEERVFRKEEMEIIMLTFQTLSIKDQNILLSDTIHQTNQFKSQKRRAKERLDNLMIQERAFPENEFMPLCPECDSKFMLFSMEDYSWTCEDCGFISTTPLLIRKKEI